MFSIGMVLAFLGLGTTAVAQFYLLLSSWYPLATASMGAGALSSGVTEVMLQIVPPLGASLLLWRAFHELARADGGGVKLARTHAGLTLVCWAMLVVALIVKAPSMVMIASLLVSVAQVGSVLAALPILRRTAA